MLNDTAQLQQMMRNQPRKAKVLTITSGKGGVGKTNMAANLAVCLAASGKRILLVDADFSLGNLDVIMNIDNKYNISHMLSGQKSIEEIIHTGPAGVEIICGASGLEDLANIGEFQRQRLLNELSHLQENCDAIIIDNAAGISKSVVAFCLASDHVLVVTTPEATAMTDAYAMIKVLVAHRYAGKISLVVNMADTIAEGKKTYQQISNVARRFLGISVYDAGVIIKDEKLSSAVKQRKPVVLAYPKAQITSSLAALAAKLSNGFVSQAEGVGFFRKVVDWFF
jgi:flagellar biosynthesis protein FlhG